MLGRKNISISQSVRDQHGKDESYHAQLPPDLVVFPEDVPQISDVARICNENGIPLVPFGTGTGLEGGVGAIGVRRERGRGGREREGGRKGGREGGRGEGEGERERGKASFQLLRVPRYLRFTWEILSLIIVQFNKNLFCFFIIGINSIKIH